MPLRSFLLNFCNSFLNARSKVTARRRIRPTASDTATIELLEQRKLLSAGPVALGPKITVDPATQETFDNTPSVSSNAAGNTVVVWTKILANGTGQIDGQRYNAAGVAQGNEFTIASSTSPTAEFGSPRVAMDSTGDFVVTWSDTSTINAQRFNSLGHAEGPRITVATNVHGFADPASVGIDAMGDFVVVWSSRSIGVVGETESIFAQVYSWSGAAKGNKLTIANGNDLTTSVESPVAAMNAKGDFVVAWQSNGIVAQRFNLHGVAQTSRINVASGLGINFSGEMAVAINSSDQFVVTWQSIPPFVNGQEIDTISAQQYDSSGHPEAKLITVATGDALDSEHSPSVAMNSAGDIVVAWHSGSRSTNAASVHAQAYTPTGMAIGNPIVQMSSGKLFTLPSVAIDAGRQFVIAWVDNPNGSEAGIDAQRYRL